MIIKKFKSFNENIQGDDIQEVINTCKDISLDLKDDGFEVKVKYNNWNSFTIMISKDVQFTKKDIIDVFNHLKSYFETIGYTTNNEFTILKRFYNIDLDGGYYLIKKIFIKKKVEKVNENNSYEELKLTEDEISDIKDIFRDIIDEWDLVRSSWLSNNLCYEILSDADVIPRYQGDKINIVKRMQIVIFLKFAISKKNLLLFLISSMLIQIDKL